MVPKDMGHVWFGPRKSATNARSRHVLSSFRHSGPFVGPHFAI